MDDSRARAGLGCRWPFGETDQQEIARALEMQLHTLEAKADRGEDVSREAAEAWPELAETFKLIASARM